MMGEAAESNFWMLGGSASCGSRPRTRSTRVRTSSAASFRFGAPREVQPDRARPFGRRRVDLLEPGHRRERLLERAHDQLLDLRAARRRRSPTRTVMLG